jgi:hypothetical protein
VNVQGASLHLLWLQPAVVYETMGTGLADAGITVNRRFFLGYLCSSYTSNNDVDEAASLCDCMQQACTAVMAFACVMPADYTTILCVLRYPLQQVLHAKLRHL